MLHPVNKESEAYKAGLAASEQNDDNCPYESGSEDAFNWFTGHDAFVSDPLIASILDG